MLIITKIQNTFARSSTYNNIIFVECAEQLVVGEKRQMKIWGLLHELL